MRQLSASFRPIRRRYERVWRGLQRKVRVSWPFQHFHRRIDALARLPSPALAAIGAILAQKLAFRPLSAAVLGVGAGGLSLEPVARLYLARPLAVSPAPLLTGSFSPRPTDRDTPLRAITTLAKRLKHCPNHKPCAAFCQRALPWRPRGTRM